MRICNYNAETAKAKAHCIIIAILEVISSGEQTHYNFSESTS